MTSNHAMTRGDQVERLLFYMPVIADRSEHEWPRSFARSIMRQSGRRGWRPSGKQLQMMRELVSDLFAHGYEGGAHDVFAD